MATDTLTITFRAKRDTFTDWSSPALAERTGYRIPAITVQHVTTPRSQWGTVHTLSFSGSGSTKYSANRVRNALRNAGLDDRYAWADETDERVTITPRGNGFMADISITIPFTVATTRRAA